MDFGRVEDVNAVDFRLPPDHSMTTDMFKRSKKKAAPNVYIGCAKWGRADWIGKLYPKGTKPADYLKYYVQNFNSIELNAMFYQLFPKATVQKWADTAPKGFIFCPKFTQSITHIKRLKNAERDTENFIDTVSVFGDKLGTSFIQLGDNFGPKDYASIHDYLSSLPKGFDAAIEFRHPDMHKDTALVHDTYALMRELGISSVITDTAGRRDVLHMKLTTPTAFIRWVGNSLHKSDFDRIDEWIDRIEVWLDSGLETLYFFIHQHDELYSPEISGYMIEQLNKRCKLKLKPPNLLNQQGDLF